MATIERDRLMPPELTPEDAEIVRAAQRLIMESLDHSRAASITVVSEDGSDPASGSVRPKLAMISPAAMPGSHFCFCSSVPVCTRICPARPLLVPNIERNAGAA